MLHPTFVMKFRFFSAQAAILSPGIAMFLYPSEHHIGENNYAN